MSRRRRRLLAYGGLTIKDGLQLWLDAADTSTIVSSGGAVSQWNDKSGNGNNATQGTGSAQPTTGASTQNSLNILDFDGGDTLALPSAIFSIPNGANTIFVVGKRNAETGIAGQLISISDGGLNRCGLTYNTTAGQILYRSNTGATASVTGSGFTNTNFQIVVGRRSGTTQAISVNGGAETTNANGADENGCDEAFIGSISEAVYLTGAIAEILIYDRSLSATEISVVNSYLAAKWGISI